MTAARVARAFLRKDFIEALSHRGGLLLGAAGVLATLLLLSGLARSAGGAAADSPVGAGSALGFLVIGIALFAVHDALVRELPRRLRALQQEGTLEAVFAARTDPALVACCLPLFPLGRALVRAGALIAIGAVAFDLRLASEGAPAALALLAAAIPLFAAIGLAAAAAAVVWRRAETAIALYGTLSALLGGVFFPAEALPALLRPLSGAVPLGLVLEPLRAALLGLLGPGEMLAPLARIAAAGALLLPASLFLLRRALHRALRDGALAHA